MIDLLKNDEISIHTAAIHFKKHILNQQKLIHREERHMRGSMFDTG